MLRFNNGYDQMRLQEFELIMSNMWNSNKIGDSGACSIGEGLKVNSTLTELNLEIDELITNVMKWNDMNMNW